MGVMHGDFELQHIVVPTSQSSGGGFRIIDFDEAKDHHCGLKSIPRSVYEPADPTETGCDELYYAASTLDIWIKCGWRRCFGFYML